MNKTEAPIIVEQIFNSNIDKIWNALTNPVEMKPWYFNTINSFEPKVGFETRFVVKVEDRIYPHQWKVTEVVPRKRICYEWQFEGYPGKAVSEFELFEMGIQTKLKLVYKVIEDFPDNIPEFKRQSGVDGWNYLLKNSLKLYLEKDKT